LDNAPELFRLFAEALALFAKWLDRVFHIPWPLVLALFFLPVVGALDVGVWYLRGMVFPIRCGYLTVHGRKRCKRMTAGEWHKCWYHGKRRLRRTDQHLVDPSMRRWQTGLQEDDRGKFVKTVGVVGRGFLSKRSYRDTLLYHQGFARPPMDVRKIVPDVLDDYKSRAVDRWASLRSLGLRGLMPLTDRGSQQIATSHVLPGVINATRLTLALVALGLLLVGVSIAVPPTVKMFPEYFAAFLFTFALAFTLFGILKAEPDWRSKGRQVDSRLHARCNLVWLCWIVRRRGDKCCYCDHKNRVHMLNPASRIIFGFSKKVALWEATPQA
jgi:hypothetical protein